MESLFQILISFSNYWPKTEKYSNELQGVNINQSAIYYISINLSRQALQISEKLFFQISESFFELVTIFLNNTNNKEKRLIKKKN